MRAHVKLLLDTNIVVDFLNRRKPFYDDARLLMITGKVGEFDLWMLSSQFTDLVYILSDGGKMRLMPDALERIRGIRAFMKVASVDAYAIDRMLSTTWVDAEDALLYDSAVLLGVDGLVTRDVELRHATGVRTFDCAGLFEWLEKERGVSYADIAL